MKTDIFSKTEMFLLLNNTKKFTLEFIKEPITGIKEFIKENDSASLVRVGISYTVVAVIINYIALYNLINSINGGGYYYRSPSIFKPFLFSLLPLVAYIAFYLLTERVKSTKWNIPKAFFTMSITSIPMSLMFLTVGLSIKTLFGYGGGGIVGVIIFILIFISVLIQVINYIFTSAYDIQPRVAMLLTPLSILVAIFTVYLSTQ